MKQPLSTRKNKTAAAVVIAVKIKVTEPYRTNIKRAEESADKYSNLKLEFQELRNEIATALGNFTSELECVSVELQICIVSGYDVS